MLTEKERARMQERISRAEENRLRWAEKKRLLQKQLRDRELQALSRKERTHLLCRLGGLVCLAGAADQRSGDLRLTEAQIVGVLVLALREENEILREKAGAAGTAILDAAKLAAEERRRKRAEKKAEAEAAE